MKKNGKMTQRTKQDLLNEIADLKKQLKDTANRIEDVNGLDKSLQGMDSLIKFEKFYDENA